MFDNLSFLAISACIVYNNMLQSLAAFAKSITSCKKGYVIHLCTIENTSRLSTVFMSVSSEASNSTISNANSGIKGLGSDIMGGISGPGGVIGSGGGGGTGKHHIIKNGSTGTQLL